MAIEDLIPMDAFFSKQPKRKNKKVDKEAMSSPIMRIPRMDIRVARDLLDIKIKETFQLHGRDPESLFEEIKKIRPKSEDWRLPYIRMAVYYAENEEHEPKMLHPQAWQ